ncbi:leucine-rich repeat-containing protein 75A isoform X2 [Panthera onca]
MGTRQTKGSLAERASPGAAPVPRRERPDFWASLLLRAGDKAGRAGAGAGLPPYHRRVGMVQELLRMVRQGRREEAGTLLQHLRQDLGMESTSLDDVLYRYASFRNLVDPITHDLIISLARYIHCPKPLRGKSSGVPSSAGSSFQKKRGTGAGKPEQDPGVPEGSSCFQRRRRAGRHGEAVQAADLPPQPPLAVEAAPGAGEEEATGLPQGCPGWEPPGQHGGPVGHPADLAGPGAGDQLPAALRGTGGQRGAGLHRPHGRHGPAAAAGAQHPAPPRHAGPQRQPADAGPAA